MLRVIFTIVFFCVACCIFLGSAVSLKAEDGFNDGVVIRIVHGNNSLLQLFNLVQDQTTLNFAYDEKEIDKTRII